MGLDGIPAGTIRSPRGNSDLDPEIDPKKWCGAIGHRPKKFADGTFCVNCWEQIPDSTTIARTGKE